MPESVLIVEDNPLNLELASDILANSGYEVLTAADAQACRALLSAHRPDLVLLDLRLPDANGLDLTRELRAAPATRDLVIVALTAHAMADDRDKALAAGCDDYLTKPINTRTLADQVAAFIAQRSHL